MRSIDLARCEGGSPVPLRIHTPDQPGAYPVVVFQHGFITRNTSYNTILTHLASHGFVVVAPQMYEPGLAPLMGNPTAAQEAVLAGQLIDWLTGHLTDLITVEPLTSRLGIAGHSRGGKVAWLVAVADPGRIRAIAGVDPVDGRGGPAGNQPRVVQGEFQFDFPSLVIGAGLEGGCAPTGDNHVQFFAASPAPAWHIIALGQGHADMYDEPDATIASQFCPSGSDRDSMRRLTAGLLVALFRGALQNDPAAFGYLSDAARIPFDVSVESR